MFFPISLGFFRFLKESSGIPGLQYSNPIEHTREFEAILGAVDHFGQRAEDSRSLSMQFHGDVVGQLAAHAQNHTFRVLQRVDIHHHLECYLFEVEAVAHVVISADGFGVVVDHSRFAAQIPQFAQAADRTPIKLHRTADAIHSRT